jgi:hypothetical protein
MENDIGAACEARFARWAAADRGGGDAIDECGGGEGVASLESGPAGGICLEEMSLRAGGAHFWVCGDRVVRLLKQREIVREGGSSGLGG